MGRARRGAGSTQIERQLCLKDAEYRSADQQPRWLTGEQRPLQPRRRFRLLDLKCHGAAARGRTFRRRLGPIVRQAPEFEGCLWLCPLEKRHASWDMGPGLRRDGVIFHSARRWTPIGLQPPRPSGRGGYGRWRSPPFRFWRVLTNAVLYAKNAISLLQRSTNPSYAPKHPSQPLSLNLQQRAAPTSRCYFPSRHREHRDFCGGDEPAR